MVLPRLWGLLCAIHGLAQSSYYVALRRVLVLLWDFDVDIRLQVGVEEGPADVHDHQPFAGVPPTRGGGHIGDEELEKDTKT